MCIGFTHRFWGEITREMILPITRCQFSDFFNGSFYQHKFGQSINKNSKSRLNLTFRYLRGLGVVFFWSFFGLVFVCLFFDGTLQIMKGTKIKWDLINFLLIIITQYTQLLRVWSRVYILKWISSSLLHLRTRGEGPED